MASIGFPLNQFLRKNYDSEKHMGAVVDILEESPAYRSDEQKVRNCPRVYFAVFPTIPVSTPFLTTFIECLPPCTCSQNFLVDCLSSIDFFQKTPRSLGLEIARVATFLKVDKGGMVFEQGTVGTAFYVILSGSVSIRVKDVKKPDSLGYEAAVLIAGKSFGELGTIHVGDQQAFVFTHPTPRNF